MFKFIESKISVYILLITLMLSVTVSESYAGLGKWLRTEVIPTMSGERPLKIKNHISIKHDNKVEFRVGNNSAKIRVGNVTMQTGNLSQRLAQAGCVYATGGDVLKCAPDIVERELLNIADGINTNGGHGNISPSFSPPPPYFNQVSATMQAMPSWSLMPGTTMQTCGCWGYNPAPIAFEPKCSRSRVILRVCNGWCQTGGQPYGYVCM